MHRRVPFWPLLLVLLLGSCGAGGILTPQVSAPPAPTAVPLASPAPTALPVPPTDQPPVSPTDKPAAPTARPATSMPTPNPTRVVPPPEPIALPPGFGLSVYATGLNNPRMMALGPDGQLYLAERGNGRIVRLPDRDGDGVSDGLEVVADGLQTPSSLAFAPDGSLYVGETERILRLSAPDAQGIFQVREVLVSGLPGGGHNTRTVLLSPDGRWLYVSVGSSCNVCLEEDERRATIMRYTADGADGIVYARGLRNAVGIVFRPGTEELWATCNGRDFLGDDQPPETVNRVQEGDDFGWPRCHAGRIIDPDFGSAGACDGVASPAVEIQAHSAPLGLAFYTGAQFPAAYQGSLFVALHGSWNRSVPTGYKVVRMDFQDGRPGPVEDFATGWLRADGSSWGRPVDLLTAPDGSLWVSDDGEGRIYRVFYSGD
jgi:glucose/arabinose dehydrogenase